MADDRSEVNQSYALLTFGAEATAIVASESELLHALSRLSFLSAGESASLSRGPKDYVSATRRGDFWSAEMRRGGWWTFASFTADMTTEYSAYRVRQSRADAVLRNRAMRAMSAPPAEHMLTTEQVRTIFVEYFVGGRFSIPQSGA